MAEFKLGRIRFVWKGEWSSGATYYKDDVVRYGGRTYICQLGHTADSDFNIDLLFSENGTDRWSQMTDGQEWQGDWQTSTVYKINDIVKYGALIYICKNNHTSSSSALSGLEANLPNDWELFAEGLDWKGNWTTSFRYKINDIVKYGGYIYVCNTAHVSSAALESDLDLPTKENSKWDEFNKGTEYKGNWSSGVSYKINDIVKQGSALWICIDYHQSDSNFANDVGANWEIFVEGLEFESEWSNVTTYQPGDIVRYGGNQYVSKTNHVNSNPETGTANWDLFSQGFRFLSDWNDSTTYRSGDVVRVGAYTFVSLSSNINQEPPNETYWERLNSGIRWRGDWIDDVEYKLGDAVKFGANAYICVLPHRSEGDDGSTLGGDINSRPDQDFTGTYWNILSIGTETGVLIEKGDMVYFGGAGPVRLPIGKEGQVLRSTGEIPEWVDLGHVDQVYFVAPHGEDSPSPIWGKSYDKPFKTIRYACEQVEKGPLNPNAQYLLELNRVFMQKEITEWIQYQVTNNIAPFTTSFTYDTYKCERDVGFIVDRLIWDIGHGGNLKIRAAAQTYVNALAEGPFSNEDENNGSGPYTRLAEEADADIAAYNYLLEVIEAVLNNQAPAVNYQNTNTDNSTAVVEQYFNLNLQSETGVLDRITSLVGIITTALADGDSTNIPARDVPNTLIQVATGRYRETLPIIVPANTCVKGDELRSTNAGPAGSLIDISDSYYTIKTLDHIENFISDIVTGSPVTPTTGNTTDQNIEFPYADTDEGNLTSSLVGVMKLQSDYRLGTMHASYLTDPVGYNSTYLAGYGNARKLIKENVKFLQEEVIEFLENNYSKLEIIGSISGTTLTVTTVNFGTVTPNTKIRGLNILPNTSIVEQLSGTPGGLGTYEVNLSQSADETTIKADTKYGRTKTRRDVNYVLDALIYDLTYDGNALSVQAGLAYWDGDDDTQPQIPASIKSATIGSLEFLKTRVGQVVANFGITPLQTKIPQFRNTAGSANAITLTENNIDDIIEIINVGPEAVGDTVTLVDPTPVNGVNSTTALIGEYTVLEGGDDFDAIKDVVETYLDNNYSDVDYSVEKARRDAGLVLKAIGFDFMFNSNYQTIKAAHAYLRGTASELFDIDDRIKEATRNSLKAAKDAALTLLSDSTAQERLSEGFKIVDQIIFGGSNEGDVCQTDLRNRDYAILQLERNRTFIIDEVSAYIDETFSDVVTNTTSSSNVITISDTSWLKRNTEIIFTGVTFGGLVADIKYYVQNIVNGTTFTVALSRYASTPLSLTTASGTMAVSLSYNTDLCLRDVGTYIDALKWDIRYSSNYKSKYVARYYSNAVIGSQEEDMFYLRDGTGLRDMTTEGLSGDLTPENIFGTSRPTAGAYASLDPGWGPADFRTWIINRSPYVQGLTTLGKGAIGQKIDGALHNGGNDSIVSNDFTQVISDGIGAWITNNGRAELVSVFTYYAHIGYLSENGGRIRGTNGNNSYGDFGSVAEGFDEREIPTTGFIDNIFQFKATIGNVTTTGSSIIAFEYQNAGIEYTEADFTISGGGNGAIAVSDEIRDGGVYQIRLLDNGISGAPAEGGTDGQFGGFGYLTNSNTAQAGTLTTIQLAATDSEGINAYIGMKVVINGGAGVGQFGIITNYTGDKIASVVRESDGLAGWDHFIPGTPIVAIDASSTYTVEPRISFAVPPNSAVAGSGLAQAAYNSIDYTLIIKTDLDKSSTTTGDGVGATFNVVTKGLKFYVFLNQAGTGYQRLDTLTIDMGSSIEIDVIVTAVDEITGEILTFEYEGVSEGGRFISLGSTSSDVVKTTDDGVTWNTYSLPSSSSWRNVASGRILTPIAAINLIAGEAYEINDIGNTTFTSVGAEFNLTGQIFIATSEAVGTGNVLPLISRSVTIAANSTTSAYSDDNGETWVAGGALPESTTWTKIAYGNGNWVAIANSGITARSTNGGSTWSSTATLPAGGIGNWNDIIYGKGIWLAISSGVTAATSTNNGSTWSSRTLPTITGTWNAVSYGNNRFVISGSGGNTAYSFDGITWNLVTTTVDENFVDITYGQGVFVAISGTSNKAIVSEYGIIWTTRTLATENNQSIAFGNPNRDGKFVSISTSAASTNVGVILEGARAKGRAAVADRKIFEIRILEPGSNYSSAPVMTITDSNVVFEAPNEVRIGNGVLANPTFNNRGTGYTSGSAEVLSGDGFANNYQPGTFVAVRRISKLPVPGSNVVFGNLPFETFKLVNTFNLRGTIDGSYSALLQISPALSVSDAPEHLEDVTTRIRFSQVRLTGHDFLDIGTGSFEETNYPNDPEENPIPTKETVQNNGGRVFFTSTDQDGNFRVGELFAIEQSTGIATLNADAFNIAGLQELTLGNVTLGGSSATITEFSTDPFFTADSDNVIPTQRAVKAYIAAQIGGGGASLNVNSVTSGSIVIATNVISTVAGTSIAIDATLDFRRGVTGVPLAFNYFLA